MRVVVVGLGAIGSRHASNLRSLGHHVLTVDLNRPADVTGVQWVKSPGDYDSWIVATPTDTHLDVVRFVLGLCPSARILLEKPACSPREISALSKLSARYSQARIIVNDVYGHSPAVRSFSRALRVISGNDPVAKITIEFTKNRQKDVDGGRFVDRQYGEVGYEWFHMLSLLRAALPGSAYRSYLRTAPERVTRELRVVTRMPGLPTVELYASTDGNIAFPGLADFGYLSTVARQQISAAHIPYGSDLRYRFADVEFASGTHLTLVFEPYYRVAEGYKNIHTLHVGKSMERPFSEIVGDQLRTSLVEQLELLRSSSERGSELRLPEHAHMAELAKMTLVEAPSENLHKVSKSWSVSNA